MKKEIESGFFDSVDGDRKYTAEEMTEYYGHLYGSGIAYGKGNNLALITSATENRATLCDGVAYVEGRWYNQTIGIQYVIGVTDIYYSIALKCDKNERIISSVIIPGTADAPPDITSENNISYMKLYDIVSENNIVRIVKDYRGSAECPYIKPLSEKVDKEEGKGLSHNDFTDFYKKAVEAIPEELQQKADLSHTHSKSDITDFPEKLPASDVYPWAKDPQKPSYSWGEISGKPSVFPPESHSHAWSSITGKPGTFPPSYHSHGISDIDDLSGTLDEKLNIASRNYVPVRYVSQSMNFDTDFQLTSADPNKVIFTNTKSVTNSNSPTGIPMPYMLTVERLYVNGASNYFRQTFTGLMNAGSESAYIVEYQRLYIYTANPFWTDWKAVDSGEDDHKVIQEYVGGADYEYPILCSTDTEHTQNTTTDKTLKLLGMTINPKAGTITAQKFKGNLEGRASSADSVEWGNVSDKPESYPPETHSHNYAASTYAGGAALSANKLNTDAGSATVPVYFNNGVPTVCQYTLGSICTKSTSDYLPITGGTLTGSVTAPSFVGNATSASKLAIARTINGVSFDGSANIIIPRSTKHIHTALGKEGSAGYVKIATIKVTGNYANHPVEFVISQRSRGPYHLYVQFNSVASTDPTLYEFKHFDPANKGVKAYIVKSATSTWDIYIGKIEGYDHIYVLDVLKADGHEGNGYSITYTNVQASSVPTTNQTKSTAVSFGGTASSATKLTTSAGSADQPVYFKGGKPVACGFKINNQSLLYSMSEVVSSPLTVNITGLFTAYTVVVCNVLTSNGRHSLTLPLKYIKSLGTTAYYEAEGILFYYVDDNKIQISTGMGQSNPTINAVKIISLF